MQVHTIEPLLLEPIYLSMPWGGQKIRDFHENYPEGILAQTWELSCYPEGTSKIVSGQYKGQDLMQMFQMFGTALIGKKVSINPFPFRFSLIDARENLSVQVHPDAYWAPQVQDLSKSEAWYILDAEPNAGVYIGFNSIDSVTPDKDLLKNLAQTPEKLIPYLHKQAVNKGDFVFVPAGTSHAIGKGVLALEISQSGNTTYRLYDWGRPRQLTVDQFLMVLDPTLQAEYIPAIQSQRLGSSLRLNYQNHIFAIKTYAIQEEVSLQSHLDYFEAFFVTSGSGQLSYDKKNIPLKKGDTVFIPACLGHYSIKGPIEIFWAAPVS